MALLHDGGRFRLRRASMKVWDDSWMPEFAKSDTKSAGCLALESRWT